ncbi:ZYRO0G11220p [Zygosaccharomyces rouxii]|uniref:U1 small nuclear ribonucleoprotein component SNU71 n=1 Tax=Zygosaccharomyces rouxii (strain ATCC 2623 / CBS 732 / NBRC 1130 / NCYC 568 / NRRL Y-229) TaxID=559307 RepID=C5E0B0_ZYGRC|nr:uncharacterized protein ZYRO0G11220g [Zygosaccharomyces rouxii]KAH9202538.1 hypothetical protein LQ764DRAFT_212073 [Zygosaccharomyces rouxii]CAR29544.1 ZYRO0G11220p [Zygosaccharomyces rouxii]
MSEIIYVSPQLYLNSDTKWKSDGEKPGYIPILRADLYKFQESLKGVLSSRSDQNQGKDGNLNSITYSIGSDAKTEYVANSGPDGVNQGPTGSTKFQTLQHFLPISLEQQLHTVSIMGIPVKVANKDVETFLHQCIRLLLQHLDAAQQRYEDFWQCWTSVQSLETQEVFVRFSDIDSKLFASFVKIVQGWFQSDKRPGAAEIHMDVNTEQLIKDQQVEPRKPSDTLIDSLNRLWQELDQSPTDKTQKQESNVEYQVDLTTLSDLPQDSLDQLCQDIVKFRTRVLTIEREKRVRESYEESKRRRQQMMMIFDQIRRSRRDAGDDRAELEEEEEGEEEEDEEEIEAGDEDDWTLEQRRQDLQRQEADHRYKSLLTQLQSEWEPELADLQRKLFRANHYEQVRLEEQPLHLKELSHLAVDPHYDHNRSYRQEEETRDEIDRKEHVIESTETNIQNKEQLLEGKQSAATIYNSADQDNGAENNAAEQQFKIKFAFKRAIDNSTRALSDEEDEGRPIVAQVSDTPTTPTSTTTTTTTTTTTEAATNAPDVLPEDGLDTKLEELNRSGLVQELVKEYLGVYEQELVDYIFDTIRKERNKVALLTELRETFDEDAATIVENIWGSVHLTTS